MKLEDYKVGRYIRMEGYRSLILSKINYDWEWEDSKLSLLVAEANRLIGEISIYSKLLPNVDVYIKMLSRIEANSSNRIEGAKTTIEEELLGEDNIEEEKKEDLARAKRYIEAINHGAERIKDGGNVCTKLMKELHKILMQEEDIDHKLIGKVRNMQNWVGGDSIENAEYVPPPYTEIEECLADFEEFANNEEIDTPHIVKLAILHYQFETIHPFLGGNGKIGRMIIPFYMKSKGMLNKPCLYLSEYLEKNKDRYFEELMNVRDKNNIIDWIKFFLESVIQTAKLTEKRFEKLSKFYDEIENLALDLPVKPENAFRVINVLFEEPIIDRTKLGELAGVKEGTMRTIINSLTEMGVIDKINGNDKSKIIVFKEYMDIFFK